MEIAIPAIPAGVILLLEFFAPYAISIVTNPAWSTAQKRIVAIVVSIVLALGVLAVVFFGFGEPIPQWPVLLLLAVAVCQASYDLVHKEAAHSVAQKVGIGSNQY